MTNESNLRNAALLAFGLATIAYTTGCAVDATDEVVDGDEPGLEVEVPEGVVLPPEVCEPGIRAAAITKQISHLDDAAVDVEVVTLSGRPFLYDLTQVAGPEGLGILALATECVPSTNHRWRCSHSFTVDAREKCVANGEYTLTLSPVPDGSACASSVGAESTLKITIATENLCTSTEVSGTEP
jgi:hypothetical protein